MDACPNKFIRREETFGSNLSLTCFGKIQLAEEKRLRNPNDVYAEQRRKALAKKHKKIEDDGEDPSEGVEPYKLRLNLPFFTWGRSRTLFLTMRIDSESLDIGAYGLKVFWREVTLEVVPRSEHRHKIKSDDEHNRGVMPASRPRPRQGSKPTYYCANPTINI
jgi:hypothetical protein